MACTVECLYVPHRRVRVSVSAGHSWHALVLAHVMATPAACEDPLNRTVNRELLYTSDDEYTPATTRSLSSISIYYMLLSVREHQAAGQLKTCST